jgi:hypothetical protein
MSNQSENVTMSNTINPQTTADGLGGALKSSLIDSIVKSAGQPEDAKGRATLTSNLEGLSLDELGTITKLQAEVHTYPLGDEEEAGHFLF